MYSRLLKTNWLKLHQRLSLRARRQFSTGLLKRKEAEIQAEMIIHGFVCTKVEQIPEFNITAYCLTHDKTKTDYLHLERDDSDNVFAVEFRTPSPDSKGTAHILEHIVLCGSEKYPVRDPFGKMQTRSLATFMNAITGPDLTVYPFSTQNHVDYRNLQSVYLDAVFKPILTRLDFLQEGWRLEHEILDKRESPLTFNGVVYNEMKGHLSETKTLFWQKFINTILPKGPYGVVFGGDPLHIPELSHDELKKFHSMYYHPSNARVFSYGNFPLESNLKLLNEEYFSKYSYLDPGNSVVSRQERWKVPKRAEISCRVDQYGLPVEKQNQIAIGYVMSDITSIYETFMLNVLADLMIVGPNSAFYKSLVEANISGGYSPLTNYEKRVRDTVFIVGLKDIEKSEFKTIENLADQTLQGIYEKGFENEHVESVLHRYELSIKHQSPNFGLILLSKLLPLWNQNGPVLDALKINSLLDQLKSNLKKPEYIKGTIEKYFIQNNHRLIMTMQPHVKFDEKLKDSEAKLLSKKIEALTAEEKEQIYQNGIELAKAHKKQENLEVLPCVKLEDISVHSTVPLIKHTVSGIIPLQLCQVNTNGVTYFKGIIGTECLTETQKKLLPFFNYIIDKFDTKNYNYGEFDKHVSKYTSGLRSELHITDHIDRLEQFEQGIVVASYCLDENFTKMLNVWTEILNKPNFSNTSRMSMLLNNYCSSLSNVIDKGSVYAVQAAHSLISSVADCKENLMGIHHVMAMQEVQKSIQIEDIQKVMQVIGNRILNGSNLRAAFHFSASNKNGHKTIEKFCTELCKDLKQKDVNHINWTDCTKITKVNRCLQIAMNIPIGYCSKVIPTIAFSQPDYPKLRVLSELITSKYLFPVIRGQNAAYGAGATLMLDGAFVFYSYRDPNAQKSLVVFDETSDWVAKNADLINEQNLFESKLGILREIDLPIASYMKGIDLFLCGLSYDIRMTQRERVLAVKKEDLVEVCQKYLTPDKWYGKAVLGKKEENLMSKTAKEDWKVISGLQ